MNKQIEALLAERNGYVARGLKNRVAAVDEELKRLGHNVKVEVAAVAAPETENAADARRARRTVEK